MMQINNIRTCVVSHQPTSAEIAKEPTDLDLPKHTTRLCVECKAPVTTRFCGHCGRKVHQRSALIDTALHSVEVLMNIDGRWRRTLGEMFRRPGQLLRQYLAGERHLYANPVLMLLVLTSFYVLLMDMLQIEYGQTGENERLTQAVQSLTVFSGYFAVGANVLTAWCSRWIYPTTTWPERFIVLTYASAFSGLLSIPLLLLAYFLEHDLLRSPLTWLSTLAGAWILWGYQHSVKRTLAMLLVSYIVLTCLMFALGFLIAIIVLLLPDFQKAQALPLLLSPQPIL